ncbi:hypothetical protein FS749_002996 [Ceratobasidium sp. UAMH 11750]|nr:hypothetical protein FS749_002996 [Ceratobasidium sp. UAMH 11750]
MEVLNQWQLTRSNLERAASDFLDACTSLKALALPSLASRYDHDTLETALSQVQSHINSVTIVEGQLKESRATLHLLLNTSPKRVPINRLPAEILSSIFATVTEPPECRGKRHPLARDYLTDIRLVCVQWNRVVTSAPLFWSHIDVDLDSRSKISDIPPALDPTRQQLERSRGALVHLHVSGTSERSKNGIPGLVSIIRPHITCLNSLIISGTHTSPLVRDLFELYSGVGRLGTLRSLVFDDIYEPREEYSIPWSIPSLSGLTELNLELLRKYASPPFNELVALLSNCPTLHTLRLRFLAVRASPEQDYPVIRLPCLRLLDFGTQQKQENILRLLPLLDPGVNELDVRLSLLNINSSLISSHLQPFLERSNVTVLSFHESLPESSTHTKSLLSSTPHLRALLLHYSASESLGTIGELLSSTEPHSAKPLPNLQCLCLIARGIGSEEMNGIGRIVAERHLRSLVFWGCSICISEANHSDGGEDVDEDSEVEETDGWSQDLEIVRGRFSGQVERIVVGPLPETRIRNGIDLSIQELVNE